MLRNGSKSINCQKSYSSQVCKKYPICRRLFKIPKLQSIDFNMKNYFAWEVEDDSFDQNDDKCLQRTDHTTGNAIHRMHDDPVNDYQLFLNQNEERMIHCVDEDNYLVNSQYEAQDLDYLQDDQQNELKIDSLEHPKLEFSLLGSQKDSIKEDNIFLPLSQILPEIQRETEKQPQTEPEYKLPKKWKEKVTSILEEKNIHQFSAKHNRNMAKFFVRIFSKYIKQNPDKQLFSTETQQKVQTILEKNCISLKDLESLFGGECSRSSRQFLSGILRTRLKQEVIKSQDVQNKAAYLLCSKVYALRCRSRHLTGRLQSR